MCISNSKMEHMVVGADITPTNQKIADELKVKVMKVEK